MSTITRASTLLTRARAIVEEGRWCRHALAKPTRKSYQQGHPDRFCALGAIAEACPSLTWKVDPVYDDGWEPQWGLLPAHERDAALRATGFLHNAAREFMLAHPRRYGWAPPTLDEDDIDHLDSSAVVYVNDDTNTRRAEVLAVFDAAIDAARRAEQRERQRVSRARRRARVEVAA